MGIFDAWKSTKPAATTPAGPPPCTPFARDVLRGGGPGAHHGIPQDATCIVHDASSGCLAVGTSRGLIKVFGKNGIELLLFDPKSWTGSEYTGSSGSERTLQIPVQHLCWLGYSGSHLLAVFRNGTIQVWDVASRSIIGSLGQGWAGCGVRSVAAHPWPIRPPPAANDDSRSQLEQQGAYAYLGGDNGTVYVLKCWPEVRLCTGYVVARNDAIASRADNGAGDSSSEEDEAAATADEEEDADEVVAITVNPVHEGTLLIAYSRSGAVLWDLEDRSTIRRLRRSPAKPRRGGIEGSSSDCLSGANDGSGQESLTCACWHPEGAHVAVGYDDGSFEVWSLASGSSNWSVASLRRNLLGPLTGSSGSSTGVAPPPPQRVTAAGLQLPPRLLEGGMDLADLDLGDGTPAPLLKLEFLPPVAPGQACALVVLGGVSRPVVASAGGAGTRAGMGGSIMFACAHALLPEAAAVQACALACAAEGASGGSNDGRGRSSSLRSSAGGSLRDSEGAATSTGSPRGHHGDDDDSGGSAAPKKRERRPSRMWGAVSGALHAGSHLSHPHSSSSSGHADDAVDVSRLSLEPQTSSGSSELSMHADPGGAYR